MFRKLLDLVDCRCDFPSLVLKQKLGLVESDLTLLQNLGMQTLQRIKIVELLLSLVSPGFVLVFLENFTQALFW